jgi:hypothetical protein
MHKRILPNLARGRSEGERKEKKRKENWIPHTIWQLVGTYCLKMAI